jgi:hypothetical protein
MKFEVKNSKSCRGTDGIAWSATLWIDGKKACEAMDSGRGGEINLFWVDKDLEKRFNEYVAALPIDISNLDLFPQRRKLDAGDVIAVLVDIHENIKKETAWIKRKCKTNTVFTLLGDIKGEFRTVKAVFTPAVKAFMVKKYGNKIEKIYNETI